MRATDVRAKARQNRRRFLRHCGMRMALAMMAVAMTVHRHAC
jgi:hypothetical protein